MVLSIVVGEKGMSVVFEYDATGILDDFVYDSLARIYETKIVHLEKYERPLAEVSHDSRHVGHVDAKIVGHSVK